MTTLLRESNSIAGWIERQPDKVEPVDPFAQRETNFQANSDLVDLLSHQILSCSTKVQAIVYLLEQLSVSADPSFPKVLSALNTVGKQLRHLGHSTLQLDKTANLTASLSFKPVDMAALIDNLVETFQVQAPDRFLVKVYEAGLPRVWGDAEQLQIVLDNLINNALKYSAPESPVIITAEIQRVPTDKDNGQMLISVTNFGSYIPPAEQEKLFIKFYRGEEQQAKGYGLGLPLARRLVELHGGQLEVESSIADGTTFWFTMPLAGD
jgi:NtrC-family two-component system sensor histidine kinase KinB